MGEVMTKGVRMMLQCRHRDVLRPQAAAHPVGQNRPLVVQHPHVEEDGRRCSEAELSEAQHFGTRVQQRHTHRL